MGRYLLASLSLWMLLLLPGCPDERETRRADILEIKLRVAEAALKEIKERQDKGLPVYADCTTAKMLFLGDLEQDRTGRSKRLITRLLRLCQMARPSELVEISR